MGPVTFWIICSRVLFLPGGSGRFKQIASITTLMHAKVLRAKGHAVVIVPSQMFLDKTMKKKIKVLIHLIREQVKFETLFAKLWAWKILRSKRFDVKEKFWPCFQQCLDMSGFLSGFVFHEINLVLVFGLIYLLSAFWRLFLKTLKKYKWWSKQEPIVHFSTAEVW